ncbi:MAG: hypothetical protein P4M14_10265 [Gammaproteobacteria bacterium]|nr:hypothetical protein [Gammaproteobacteria bacterium]
MSTYNRWEAGGKTNYMTSFELIELGYCQVILIENYPCNSKEELESRERYWIESLNCVNKVIPTRTVQEYYQEYYSKNKDEIAIKAKLYREKNKDQIKRIKQIYRENNKETLNSITRTYYKEHKDNILKQRNQKIYCQCGSLVSKRNISTHKNSAKHNDFMKMYYSAKHDDPAFFSALNNWHQSKIYQLKHM